MKPLYKRRTYWAGVVSGAALMGALIVGAIALVEHVAPKEIYREPATWKTPTYAAFTPPDVWIPPCVGEGKDCSELPHNTVPEPSGLWLTVLGVLLAVRNTLFSVATVAIATVGRWFGMKLEDE